MTNEHLVRLLRGIHLTASSPYPISPYAQDLSPTLLLALGEIIGTAHVALERFESRANDGK